MTKLDKYYFLLGDILNEFDFEKVHITMLHLGWLWAGIGVPSVDELKFSARDRIDDAIKGCLKYNGDYPYIVSSGGLKATAIKNEYGQIHNVQLEFILTDWDAEID